MSVRTFSSPTIDVSDARFERPWKIDTKAFLSFSLEMSKELLELEAQHLPQLDDELMQAAAASATWM